MTMTLQLITSNLCELTDTMMTITSKHIYACFDSQNERLKRSDDQSIRRLHKRRAYRHY